MGTTMRGTSTGVDLTVGSRRWSSVTSATVREGLATVDFGADLGRSIGIPLQVIGGRGRLSSGAYDPSFSAPGPPRPSSPPETRPTTVRRPGRGPRARRPGRGPRARARQPARRDPRRRGSSRARDPAAVARAVLAVGPKDSPSADELAALVLAYLDAHRSSSSADRRHSVAAELAGLPMSDLELGDRRGGDRGRASRRRRSLRRRLRQGTRARLGSSSRPGEHAITAQPRHPLVREARLRDQ